MSVDQIQTSWVREYSASLGMSPRQMDSRFINKVTVETNVGSGEYFFDRVGAIGSQPVVERYGDSPHNELDYQRRSLQVRTYNSGRLIDNDEDTLRAKIRPDSKIVMAQRAALYQTKDDVIIESLFGDVRQQDAQEVISTTSFPSANVVAVDTQASGSGATGMNVEKLRAAMQILQQYEIPDATEVYCALTPRQIRDLMGDNEMIDGDYNALRPLMSGRLTPFYGVNFFMTNRLLTDSNGYTRVPIWI